MLGLHFFAILLVFLCIELGFANTVRHRFIYSHAPENLVQEARSVGDNERHNFQKEVEGIASDDSDQMMESYAKHLLACSSVGSKLTEHLQKSIGEMASEPAKDSPEAETQEILRTVGFDDTASRMFMLTADEIRPLVKIACLKHELQFQCADAFVDNPVKIRKNIERMKQTDGNIKIMFERECAVNGDLPRVYSCIGSAAGEIHASCGSSIAIFNRSRDNLNSRIRLAYRTTVEEITTVDEGVKQTDDLEKRKMQKLEATLNQIKSLEAFRCRLYSKVESCAIDTLVDLCGEEVRDVAQTLMRVGQLRRERGDFLHENFEEMEIHPHKSCELYL